ncbi:MAG: hypothetical protein ACTSVE_05030 [Candidatus Helarchaeota archaeon]
MREEYPWYDIINSDQELMQGDFINECPIIIPPSKSLELNQVPDVTVKYYNTIIMSQSCDLKYSKIDFVLVCPVWTLNEMAKESEIFRSKKVREKLRKGNLPGYHLLNKCDLSGFKMEYMIVDFRNIYSVALSFLINFIKRSNKRLRLLPPYREHLSQAFARFFMRVGLPIDIPPFK